MITITTEAVILTVMTESLSCLSLIRFKCHNKNTVSSIELNAVLETSSTKGLFLA